MSDPTLPLGPDLVDELLSAELDGEFDAAAIELGMEPTEARERLEATSGIAERRAALRAAGAAIADVPALDELADARLRAAALDAFRDDVAGRAPRRTSRRWLVYASGGIAAALVGVFALTAVSHQSTSTSAASKAASAAAPTNGAEHAAAGSASGQGAALNPTALSRTDVVYGTFADSSQLANAAAATARGSGSYSAAVATPTSLSTAKRSATSDQMAASAADATNGVALAVPPACAPQSHAPAPTDKLVQSGTAVLAGKPVVVRVFAHGSRLVVVTLRPDCTLVDTHRLG